MAYTSIGEIHPSQVIHYSNRITQAKVVIESGIYRVRYYTTDDGGGSYRYNFPTSYDTYQELDAKYSYRVRIVYQGITKYIYFTPYNSANYELDSVTTDITPGATVVAYLERESLNTAPTTPGAFTNPVAGTVLKGGQNAKFEWGPSSDAENDAIRYQLEYSINGGAFGNSVNNYNLSQEYTMLPHINTFAVRVRADDLKGGLSAWRTSPTFNVVHNTAPTLTLNTENNLTLSEAAGQNEILVDGSAIDKDPNNTVTVRAQFNDGTIRNLNSAISDGSTPIPFSKRFTYSDKKIYDGATPLTVDLAENVDHILKVWAEDGQGGTSVIAERKFRVIHNRPPTITDTDRDLGTLIESPKITYQVNDLEGQAITVTEKINGQVIRTFEAEPNTNYTLEIPIEMWVPLQLQQHTLTVDASDTFGAKTVRTYTFTRNEDTIQLELKNPFVTDIAATRILVTPDVYVPIGSTIKIEACNNAFDEVPTWEDITGMAMNKRGYTFTNTTKTAEQWGINIRFTLEKGTATQQVRLEGFGGAFD